MLIFILFFLLLLLIGIPIAYCLGLVAFLGIALLPGMSMITVVHRMFSGLNSFILLAVPLFMLAANLMNKGKISEKLIEFSLAIVGHIRGGLGQAHVLVSMLFAGISGSSQADVGGIGKILIPSMIEEGYSKETSVGVTAASSVIGIIIPPSIPMVVYGAVTNASVGAMFLGGLVPGILIGVGQMIVVYFVAKKHNYPRHPLLSAKQFMHVFLESVPALITPLILVGGVISGLATPTEAASLACIYALILGVFVFHTIHLKDLGPILVDTLKLSSVSLFALATANALGQLLSYYQVSTMLLAFFNGVGSRVLFLSFSLLLFLFLGTFMDAIPVIVLFVPIILPAASQLGISPIHLGIITVIAMAIGQITPPYGLCLLLAGKIGNLSVEQSFKASVPYLLVILGVLVLVAFCPAIALTVPKLIKPEWFATI